MKEIKEILEAYDAAQKQGKQAALATVVQVEGSSYRRPGARMLVTEDGQLTGAISGGCLEGDALRKAFLVMMQQTTTLVTYDTNDEEDATFGLGLGCNGIIHVLIEPIDESNPNNAIQLLRRLAAKRQEAAVVTLFSLTDRKTVIAGTHLLVTKDDVIYRSTFPLHEILIKDCRQILEKQQSSFKTYISDEVNISAFIEYVNRPVSLVVIGAGNDVQPLIEIATILGWETTVVDGRPNYATKERFIPSCTVLVAKPEEVLKAIGTDSQTVFVLMTHNINYDKSMLRILMQKKLPYIGLLGPHKKFERIFYELKEEGISFSAEQLSIIHSPVGLDIGADTPEEIALSIIAEIKAKLSHKLALPLKDKTENIHSGFESNIEQVEYTRSKG
jgi:xanthine dehydrogenase accessory factor